MRRATGDRMFVEDLLVDAGQSVNKSIPAKHADGSLATGPAQALGVVGIVEECEEGGGESGRGTTLRAVPGEGGRGRDEEAGFVVFNYFRGAAGVAGDYGFAG